MLSTKVHTHVIVYHDKSREYITQKEYDAIVSHSSNPAIKGINLIKDGKTSFISFSSIAKIPSIEQFNQQYPSEKPANDFERFNLAKMLAKKTPERRLKALNNIKKGVEKYINSTRYKGTNGPYELLGKFELRINQILNNQTK